MHQEAISIITEIEKSIDTNALNYGGVCAWPLFRQRIWIHLMNEYYKSMSGPSAPSVNNDGPSFSDVSQLNTHIIGGSSSPLIHVDHQASEEAMQTSTEAPDLLFFLRPEEHRDSIGDKAYAKILDSLFDRLSQYSRLKIERFMSDINRSNVSFLIDVGHARVSATALGFSPYDFMERTKPFTSALHLSDNDGQEDQNLAYSANSWFWELLEHYQDIPHVIEAYALSDEEMKRSLSLPF
ncbi:MAG: hypothetical protein RIC29_13965 [Rhodospirillaceae bacterium]